MGKYLDSNGLTHFIGLIKSALSGKADVNHTHSGYAASSHTHGTSDVTGAVWYGTCSTAASTQKKVVTCSGFAASNLVAGTLLAVCFANAQTYNGTPTLNVQSTGAKNIIRLSASSVTNAARYEWNAGEIVLFVYDGTYWCIVEGGQATATYYGRTKLVASATSSSAGTALAPTALNSTLAGYITSAPIFSTTTNYAVGDLVRYSYGVYECTTAHSAGAWDDSHFTAYPTLQDQVDGKANKGHVHGNITSAGDITATAPTIASGDKLIINDESASKITNGPAFGTDTTKFLCNDGTWAVPAGGRGGGNYLADTDPVILSNSSDLSQIFFDSQYAYISKTPAVSSDTNDLLNIHIDNSDNTQGTSAELFIDVVGSDTTAAAIDLLADDGTGASNILIAADTYTIENPSAFLDALGVTNASGVSF